MPDEIRTVRDNTVAKEGAFKVPLDEFRSLDTVTYTCLSGISGVVYTIASGKEAYLDQVMYCELSGNASIVQLHSPNGSGIGGRINVAGNTTVTWDPRACGPITSGIKIFRERFCGDITLCVHVDPKREE
jgi:hypothetical protein